MILLRLVLNSYSDNCCHGDHDDCDDLHHEDHNCGL